MLKRKRPVILIAILVILPWLILIPCGPYSPLFRGYSLINPEILGQKLGKPFLFSEAYYTYYFNFSFDRESESMDENIAEWQRYFCGYPKLADVDGIIYDASIKNLQLLKKKENNCAFILPKKYQRNTLAIHLSTYEHDNFLDYLIFAKECEPFVNSKYENRWHRDEKTRFKRLETAQKLLVTGKEKYQKATDDFIKLRYAFQIVRLANYFSGDAVAEFENYVTPLNHVNSIMQYWALSHKAGALVRSKEKLDKIEGNYLFSKVMANSNFRSGAHYRSISISSDEEWAAVLKRCENKEEKAILHYIRALDMYSKAVEEMEAIYDLYPDASVLEVLLIREIQKLEAATLEDKFYGFEKLPKDFKGIPKPQAKSYLKRMKKFVKKVVREKKTRRPELWSVVDGYLEFLDGNLRTAQQILRNAPKNVANGDLLNDQIEVLQFTTLLSIMNTVEPWMEEKLGNLIIRNANMKINFQVKEIYDYDQTNKEWKVKKSPSFEYSKDNYILAKMADLYYKKGNYGKAYLCLYSIYGLKFYPHVQANKSILNLFDKTNKNAFENYLLDKEKIKTRTEVAGILGTTLLSQDRLYEAEAVFSQIPDYKINVEDPFKSKTYHANAGKKSSNAYSQLALTKKVIALKNQIRTFSGNTPKAHLELGNYYFNTSYFGDAWKARDYFISIYESEKLNHLLQHGYIVKQPISKNHIKTYKQIERDFANTEYYKMVIKQCEDYTAYISQ